MSFNISLEEVNSISSATTAINIKCFVVRSSESIWRIDFVPILDDEIKKVLGNRWEFRCAYPVADMNQIIVEAIKKVKPTQGELIKRVFNWIYSIHPETLLKAHKNYSAGANYYYENFKSSVPYVDNEEKAMIETIRDMDDEALSLLADYLLKE